MIADKIVEPTTSRSIPLLEVLPPDDAAFYASESHVVSWEAKLEIEAHYGFIGGQKSEWIKYLRRPDVRCLWDCALPDDVEAISGVSCVPKKNQVDQRKLIMSCAANDAFCDLGIEGPWA